MSKNLKKTEISIIKQLELNSRTSFSTIGKKTRMSQQRISYLTNSLIKKGIIQKFFTLIDYSRLGLIGFRVYFRINYINETEFNKLIKFFVSHPHTYWIKGCSGRYDLICTFLASNVSQFNKILRKIMEKFPTQLQNYTILTTVVIRFFGKKYLFGGISKIPQIILGEDRPPEKIDEIDLKILHHLSNDTRISSVKLADSLSLTPKTVINNINLLQEREIIKGFRTLIDSRDIQRMSMILLIKYHNISTKLENKLINYLKVHPNITCIVKTLGEWDIEIMITTKDTRQFRKVEREIRQEFALLIQHIESIPMEKTYKLSYFPEFMLQYP